MDIFLFSYTRSTMFFSSCSFCTDMANIVLKDSCIIHQTTVLAFDITHYSACSFNCKKTFQCAVEISRDNHIIRSNKHCEVLHIKLAYQGEKYVVFCVEHVFCMEQHVAIELLHPCLSTYSPTHATRTCSLMYRSLTGLSCFVILSFSCILGGWHLQNIIEQHSLLYSSV